MRKCQFRIRAKLTGSCGFLRCGRSWEKWRNMQESGGDAMIPTDQSGRMLINYRGPDRTFPLYPVSDILDGTSPVGTFKDKIVLIGPTALGIYDLRVTPFTANMAGIEKHANVVDNILHRDFLYRAETGVLLLVFLFAIVLGITLPRLGAKSGAAIFLAFFACYLGSVHHLFVAKGIWFNLVYPAAALFFGYTSQTAYRFFTEERRARDIRKMFSSYVSKRIVDELIRDPSKAKLGGDARRSPCSSPTSGALPPFPKSFSLKKWFRC